eukprot:TRINITY_DN22630_c0_g1_i1.p1 TRINITY_DN22630_c0_g1~~TRINITY_DN22630_c0_g1_i1.p1  ORF type:complete len:115 (+),score=7.22 TRINITY_DN22630_c0_g1_i1:106-450(+)
MCTVTSADVHCQLLCPSRRLCRGGSLPHSSFHCILLPWDMRTRLANERKPTASSTGAMNLAKLAARAAKNAACIALCDRGNPPIVAYCLSPDYLAENLTPNPPPDGHREQAVLG